MSRKETTELEFDKNAGLPGSPGLGDVQHNDGVIGGYSSSDSCSDSLKSPCIPIAVIV